MAAGFQVLQLKGHSADVAASAAEATSTGDEEIILTAGEEATAMEVFALLDVDNSGFIEQNEVDVLFGGLANRCLALFRLFVSWKWLFWSHFSTCSAHCSSTALHLILALTSLAIPLTHLALVILTQ